MTQKETQRDGSTSTTCEFTTVHMEPFGRLIDLSDRASTSDSIPDVRALAAAVKDCVDEHDFLLVRGLHEFVAADGGASRRTVTIEEALEELMAAFGPQDAAIHFRGVHDASAVVDHPTIRVLGTSSSGALLDRVGYCWHQDSPPFDCTTVLYCDAAPDVGGATLFAECAALWSRLRPEQQSFLEKNTAVFSNRCVPYHERVRRMPSSDARDVHGRHNESHCI